MGTPRDLFIPALKEAEGRGNFRREVLELMLERTMDYCEATHARLNDGFGVLVAGHGGFARFYVSAMREFAHLTAQRATEQFDSIDTRIRELAEIEVEPSPYRLAAVNDEAKQLMVNMAQTVEQLRQFRATLAAYPDAAAGLDAAIKNAEGNAYFDTASNLMAAGKFHRQYARA